MKNTNALKILGISGSLRENSSNTNILKTIGSLLPEKVDFIIFDQLHSIPPFNPGDEENEAVRSFKSAVATADGVVISTPEYAFGVPGILKNALDWTVSTGEFNEKPVSAISASPLNSGGDKALASLLLTLTALGTKRNEYSSLSIPNIKLKSDPGGNLKDEATISLLAEQVANLLKMINSNI